MDTTIADFISGRSNGLVHMDMEHSRETISRAGGRQFINDSFSTRPNTTWYTMENIYKPIIWIAGDSIKFNDSLNLHVLLEAVEAKVKGIVVLGFGEVAMEIQQLFTRYVPIIITASSMAEAVAWSYLLSSPGDAILLSPATPSFGTFENYEDRGNEFTLAVRQKY